MKKEKKCKNPNHPAKGSRIKVEPIKDLKDIKAIKKILSDNPRNLALFVLGINTNLRASDLVRIKIKQVDGLNDMDDIEIYEKKTGKKRRITLNAAVVDAIKKLIKERREGVEGEIDPEMPLFTGQRGPLTVPTINALVKSWCKAINLRGNFGSHTLRKTFGYQQRVRFGVGLPELMVTFNHTTQKQTLDYLCVQPEEVKNIYSNEI